MQSFLAKCVAIGIVAGGFTLTGDLGWIADRGRRLLKARTVPSEQATIVSPPAPEQAKPPQVASPERLWLLPGEALLSAPVGRPVAVPAPPSSGPSTIDLSQLGAGKRLLVWVRRTGASGRTMPVELIAFDIIDSRTGEALEHRHAALTHGSNPAPVHAAPRRVVIEVDATGRLSTGRPLRLTPLHGVNGLGNAEAVGTVVAFDMPGMPN